MPLQVNLFIGPGPDSRALGTALSSALDRLSAAQAISWNRVVPATETGLRQGLVARPGELLLLAANVNASAASYVTLTLEDSQGAPRSLNAQALAQLLRQAAPGMNAVVLLPFDTDSASRASPRVIAASRGVADALVGKGIAAVVALPLAEQRLERFVAALARGEGIGEAVARANLDGVSPAAVCVGDASLRLLSNAQPALNVAPPASVPAPPVVATIDPVALALRAKRQAARFDVFLCHNSADKPAVKLLGQRLKDRGILPWLDEWELPPGQPWQPLLEKQIQSIASAAVFFGPAGISPWHQQEMRGFISEFVQRSAPVIPVLLAGASGEPEVPLFMRQLTWVDFRRTDPDPFERLVWGITQRRGDE